MIYRQLLILYLLHETPYNESMKQRIKKTALFMLVFGLLITSISGYFTFKQYELIQHGQRVSGTVTRIISVQGDDGTTYKPEVTYTIGGQTKRIPLPTVVASRHVRWAIGLFSMYMGTVLPLVVFMQDGLD